jgi:hypothetical protein
MRASVLKKLTPGPVDIPERVSFVVSEPENRVSVTRAAYFHRHDELIAFKTRPVAPDLQLFAARETYVLMHREPKGPQMHGNLLAATVESYYQAQRHAHIPRGRRRVYQLRRSIHSPDVKIIEQLLITPVMPPAVTTTESHALLGVNHPRRANQKQEKIHR